MFSSEETLGSPVFSIFSVTSTTFSRFLNHTDGVLPHTIFTSTLELLGANMKTRITCKHHTPAFKVTETSVHADGAPARRGEPHGPWFQGLLGWSRPGTSGGAVSPGYEPRRALLAPGSLSLSLILFLTRAK